MTDLSKLFDSYSRQARLYPALLVLFPALLVVLSLFPSALTVGQTLISIAVACGVLFFLADFARARGKAIEPKLLSKWGGWPTTIWLRHRDQTLPADQKHRYHVFLSRQPGIGILPTAAEEGRDPSSADQRYASAVAWLKERCRGSAFPLVEKENATYGFRRNLLGLRTLAIILIVVACLLPLLLSATHAHSIESIELVNSYEDLDLQVYGALAVALIAIGLLVFVVNPRWVRAAGDQYARALLACCDTLDGTL